MKTRTHFEALLALDPAGVRWKRLEVDPFSLFHHFDSEQAAIDACRKQSPEFGFRVDRVVCETTTVYTES